MSTPSSRRARFVLATSSLLLASVAPASTATAAAQEVLPDTVAAPAASAAVAQEAWAVIATAGPVLADTTVHRRAPAARVALGTLVGGAVLGAPGLALVATPCHEIICGEQIFGVFAAATGYVVGSAVGARLAATTDGARPSVGRILGASFLAAVAGAIVWNRVGEGFEPDDPGVVDYSSWQLGAAAGVALHVAITTIVAVRAPLAAPRPRPAPPPPASARNGHLRRFRL